MDAEEISPGAAVVGTMYIVRVATQNGTFSVAYKDAARALKAVADYHEAGFSDVGVYDSTWRRLSYPEVRETISGRPNGK